MKTILFRKLVNVVTLLSFFMWNLAAAAPMGGSVAPGSGSATISQTPNGSLTTINQGTQNVVINWQGFDTTANETVRFNQPNASSVALNRINSGLPTSFAGTLSANGQVWIVNPNGVLFTGTSQVNVAGLLATTHDITNANFMAGRYLFDPVPGHENATVINNGSITVADTGMVALVAPGVENNGIIQANLGKVTLASGSSYVLDLYGDQLINFGNSAPVQNGYVSNAGKIVANGGKVYLTANSAARAVDNVINMSGVIQATTATNGAHGTIILNGGHHGKVKVSGKLIATDGGYIETSGETLDIAQGAVNPGKGGKWLVDPPSTIIIDTNPVNGDWVDQIENSINSGFDFSLGADTILVMEAISAEGFCGDVCYPTLTLSATTLLDVLANISLTYANLNLQSDGILQVSSLAALAVFGANINLYGATLAEIDGPISSTFGSVTVTGQSDIILGDVSANYGAVYINSYGGNITLNGAMNVSNQDYVEIYANQDITLSGTGTIATNNAYLDMEAGYQGSNYGDLTLNGEITATNNSVYLSASNSVYIEAPITVNGGNLDVYANGWDYGVISVDAPILLTTIEDGDAYLWAENEVDVNDSITATDGGIEIIAYDNDINIYAPISASNYVELYAWEDINAYCLAALTVTNGNLDVEAGYDGEETNDSGRLMLNGPVSVTNGDAYMYAPDSITTNDTVTVTNGGLEMETDNYSIHINGEVSVTGDHNAYFEAYAGGSVHLDAPITVMNTDGYFCGGSAIYVEAGNDNWWGKVYVNAPVMLDGGDAYFYAPNKMYINAGITVLNGDLEFELDSYWGHIYLNTSDPIMADGNVYFDNRVMLQADATVTSNFGNVYFDRTVDSGWCLEIPASLTVNVLQGSAFFWDNVGDNNPLNNLIVNGETRFGGYDIITNLSQIYNGQFSVLVDDPLLLTIQTGGIFFNGGHFGLFAPNSDMILITGADSDYVGGGIFGSVNVLSLILGGTGGAILTDSTVNGHTGLDVWTNGQDVTLNTNTEFADTLSGLYCVNGGLAGACAPVVPTMPTNTLPSLDQITNPQTIVTTNFTTVNGVWSMTVTDANGKIIETCNETGCVMNMTKNAS